MNLKYETLTKEEDIIQTKNFCKLFIREGSYEEPTAAITCKDNEQLIGVLTGLIRVPGRGDPDYYQQYGKAEQIGIIDQIAIKPEYKRKGVATQLIKMFEDYCKKNDVELLTTSEIVNESVHDLLYKNGFMKVLKQHYVVCGDDKPLTFEIKKLIEEYCDIINNEKLKKSIGNAYTGRSLARIGVLLDGAKLKLFKLISLRRIPIKNLKKNKPKLWINLEKPLTDDEKRIAKAIRLLIDKKS